MEGIPRELEAVLSVVVNNLKELEAPTNLGYNDMAIMIAFGRSTEMGTPTVNAEMISEYLGKNSAVPDNARMQPDEVQKYLDMLQSNKLIESQIKPRDYKMRDDISSCIVTEYKQLKSSHVGDLLFHGFRLHGAYSINREG